MKRQIQLRGERDWAGDDLIDLQKEPLKVLDAFFASYDACIVNGCKIVENGDLFNVAPGYVSIKGKDATGIDTSMVVPFAGAINVTLPIYLTLQCNIINDVYGDGTTKPIAYEYYASYSTVKPSSEYLEISKSVKRMFTDVIQGNSGYFMTFLEKFKLQNIASGANNYVHPDSPEIRHVTDGEKANWNSKASAGIVTTSANGLMSSADKTKLNGIASGANNYIHPNDSSTRHITDIERTNWNNKASTTAATAYVNGLMSASDKAKLDGIAEGANKYVHPDNLLVRHVTDSEKAKLSNIDKIIGSCRLASDMDKILVDKHRGVFTLVEINRSPDSPYVGSYRITHDIGHTNYLVDLYYDTATDPRRMAVSPHQSRYNNYVDVSFFYSPDSYPIRVEFSFKITVF